MLPWLKYYCDSPVIGSAGAVRPSASWAIDSEPIRARGITVLKVLPVSLITLTVNHTTPKQNVKFIYLQYFKSYYFSFSLYTSRTALIQPSFSGLFVTCAYFPEITNKQRFVKIANITTEVTCKGEN